MTINLQKVAAFVTSVFIFGASAAVSPGQQLSAPKPRPLRVIVYDGQLEPFLAHMAEEFDAVIGFETDPQQPRSRIKLKLQDASFHDVLNAVAQDDATYHWQVSPNGFVDVYPAAGRSHLLSTVVGDFRVDEVDEAEAINQLMKLPEVETSIKALSLQRREFSQASAVKDRKKVSLNLANVTVGHALHEIVKKSGGNFWTLRRQGSNGEFFSVTTSDR